MRQAAKGRFAAGLAIVLILIAGCSSVPKPSDAWLDFATLQRARTPNDALACTTEICTSANSSRAPLSFNAAPIRVAEALRSIEPTVELRTEPSGDIRARYVAITPLMRFKDDVNVLIRAAGPGQSVVAVYSRSRIGRSDFGTNAKRINTLETRLRAALE